ncbi:division/cell wall cluster transcriptional repressor MraZ [[Acholeplasma] multilocale]|uniref:division/cell wall cluster transcriptional repressor MraZ n=1 Tax=[Acholeplasma] multilocale TaxID=264638 RepID=UPI00047E922A|nr:division/cell wall cluster transcriptional repressor MraZ [[Acholeplasma] multilocale]
MLLGTYEHKLDDKLRLAIPAKLRSKLGNTLYVSKGFEGCLELRSVEEFEKWSAEVMSFSSMKSEARMLARSIFANSAEVDIDSSGRIKVPANLLELATIEKEVYILGLGSKAEIWDKKKFDGYEDENLDRMEEIAENLGSVA